MILRKPVTLCGHELDEPGHICAFFDSRAQEYEILAPYYAEGIAQGEQVITIVNDERVEEHRARLEALGISVEEAVAAETLRVCTSKDICAWGGNSLAAERMCDLLQRSLAAAQRSGKRVRTAGAMDWVTRGEFGSEQLIEFEARVNLLLPTYDCTILCVYDLNLLNAQTMMDVLATHPLVLHHRQVMNNPYYRPPIDLLADMLQPVSVGGRFEVRA